MPAANGLMGWFYGFIFWFEFRFGKSVWKNFNSKKLFFLQNEIINWGVRGVKKCGYLTFRISCTTRRRSQEVLFIHTVPQALGYGADDRSPDLTRGHFAQFCRGGFAVEGGMWRTQQIRCVFKGALQRPM